ncbi:hypothetical protein ACE5IS_09865 [Leptospira wolffii]|uniref:Lipoprotein n=1 Tax=Leptospira wolffii TaxID=409998 RepID=A0ABV5BNI5_9LEPT|nr:hypothetical protein [Leptospira wolffii]TGL52542.1 hypothetical protein EHQ61_05600 [Leptospira wolffii]
MAGCVTADRSERNLSVSKAASELSTRVVLQKKLDPIRGKKAEIFVEVLDPEADWVDALLSNFVIQDDRAMLVRLSSRYYLVFVRVKNKTVNREVLRLADLEFEHEGEPFRPLPWGDYPKDLSCLNWKGNLKNFYNVGVATLTTVFIVGAIAACAKEGNCEGVRHIGTALDLSQSGETDMAKVLSNPIFTTRLEFWNERDPWIVNPGTDKEFFILYPKSWTDNLGSRTLMSPNCF